MVGVRVRAYDKQTTGLLVIDIRVARGPAAERRQHRLHRRRVAQPRAVVDVVALHQESGELLLDVSVLVRGLCRAESGEGVAAVLQQPIDDVVERFVP